MHGFFFSMKMLFFLFKFSYLDFVCFCVFIDPVVERDGSAERTEGVVVGSASV